jgi:hypothetical protein
MNTPLAILFALIATTIISTATLRAQPLHNVPSGLGHGHVIAKVITVVRRSGDSIVSLDGGRNWQRSATVAPALLHDSIRFSDIRNADTAVEPDGKMVSVAEHGHIAVTGMGRTPSALHGSFHRNDLPLYEPCRY